MKPEKKPTSWKKARKLFNDLHLWMGIGSGLILFVVCLSGTIFTFNTEIQEALEPEKFSVEVHPGAEPLAAEVLMAKVAAEAKGKVQWVSIPADKSRTYQINAKPEEKKDGEGKGKGGRGTNYLVDPYSGDIKGTTEGPASEFFMSMFKLHRWLLLDQEIGRPIVGWATVIFTLLIISGLVIWIPQKVKNWKQGLKVKFSGNWKRTNHDLHNSLGFYSSFLLLVMALTGLTWSFEWYKDGFYGILGVEHPRERKEAPLFSAVPANFAEATKPQIADYLQAANLALPYEGDYRISLPADSAATVAISKTKVGFFAPAGADKLQLDQYNAATLKTDIFSEKGLNEKIGMSIKALHMGDIYGMFSKILYFIACLVATSLPVTGTIIWINKLRKKSKKGAKAVGKRKVALT